MSGIDDVDAFAARIGGPVVVKTVRGGYDGRGVVLARDLPQAREVVAPYLADAVPVLLEERVSMRRELSALVARSPFGQGAAWPIVETVQRRRHLRDGAGPAPGLPGHVASAAEQLGLRLAAELGVVGVLAVELFETTDGRLLVNELAMRPHNSGHWTMDGAVTSQFEQHLRAVLDYPLGDTGAIAPVTVMANVLGAPQTPAMALDERLHHLSADSRGEGAPLRQGRAARPQGGPRQHRRQTGSDGAVRERAERAAHWLSHAAVTDGWDGHA